MLIVALAGCAGTLGPESNVRPSFLRGAITVTSYDGGADDLLTAGLGKTGLAAAAAPAPVNAAAPTAAELRRLAIFNNYRAILDISPRGGYGVLYGPNIDASGADTLAEGKIAGAEYLAYDDDGSGKQNVTLMVQVPASFDKARPCIVTAVSSGSRSVYGAIGSAGEWGLKHGCAVAYADKGTGVGVHDLATNTVNRQDGTRADIGTAGISSNFTAALTTSELATFNAANPNRIAVKHAHSQQNPEKDWGTHTLDAVRFAFYVLNERFADKNSGGSTKVLFRAANTIVIASSVSNGGAAAIAATEQDTEGLIDGVAVAEPVLELMPNPGLIVKRGTTTTIVGSAKPLYDYFTLANLYQPCAALSPRAAGSPGAALLAAALSTNRCASLKAKGLLTAATVAAQADEALDTLVAAGWEPESNKLHLSHYRFAVPPVVATYANAYGKFGVGDNFCGFSYAATDASGKVVPLAPAPLAQIYGPFNGVGLSAGINIVNNLSAGGPLVDLTSLSPSTGLQDLNVDGALCQRNAWTGTDANAARVQSGVKATLRTGNLRGKPAIIVAGRADTLVPVNMNARPYFGENRIVEGTASRLSYIEVTNAQHFDAFIDNPALPGYDSTLVPLHVYFIRAMDAMWAHLTQSVPLPPSQLVRTVPRGGAPGAAPPITNANVPPIQSSPAAADQITFSGNTVTVPD
jgi:hydroxybutyrate-dimer hydrolase